MILPKFHPLSEAIPRITGVSWVDAETAIASTDSSIAHLGDFGAGGRIIREIKVDGHVLQLVRLSSDRWGALVQRGSSEMTFIISDGTASFHDEWKIPFSSITSASEAASGSVYLTGRLFNEPLDVFRKINATASVLPNGQISEIVSEIDFRGELRSGLHYWSKDGVISFGEKFLKPDCSVVASHEAVRVAIVSEEFVVWATEHEYGIATTGSVERCGSVLYSIDRLSLTGKLLSIGGISCRIGVYNFSSGIYQTAVVKPGREILGIDSQLHEGNIRSLVATDQTSSFVVWS